jgi:hypothetical protein
MFEQFIELFKAEGRNLEATNKEGVTLKALIEGHAKSGDYVAALSA